jgi:hypothetical protein
MYKNLALLSISLITLRSCCSMILTLILVTTISAQNVQLNNASFDGTKKIWVHQLPQLPDFRLSDVPPNGALYSLDYKPSSSSPSRGFSHIQRMYKAGINGVQILLYDSDLPVNVMEGHGYLQEADKLNGAIKVAPCFNTQNADTLINHISNYAEVAAKHPNSVAKINGKYVIYTFGSDGLSVDTWKNIRSRLQNAGIQTYFINDMGFALAVRGFKPEIVSPYFSVFEASYIFDDRISNHWNSIINFLNNNNRLFAGGVQPGYDRETCDICGYTDAEATAKYRRELELNIGSGLHWINVVSWNDIDEAHEVRPTSHWNHTRSDITAFYSAKLGAVPLPAHLKDQAQLYITSPTYVRLGSYPRAEALVLNSSSSAVTVNIQLYDGNGRAYGNSYTTTVNANTAGTVTIPSSATVGGYPDKRFLRAKATMTNGAGEVLQTVTSAPIIVYNQTETPTAMLRRLYYSIPAYKALPGNVGLRLSGSPLASPSTGQVTVTPPSGVQVRFAEVLQNTRQVKNMFNTAPFVTAIPLENGKAITGWQRITAAAHGFYIGRVIDEQERVGYSDPIYVNEDGSYENPSDTPEAKPDLVVTDVTWSPGNAIAGQGITFSATIKNQGTAATPAGVVHGVSFWVDGTVVSWSDSSTEPLAAGATRTVIANGGPSGTNQWIATAGTHTVEAYVDDVDRIKGEVDESNNKLQKSFNVGTGSTPTPTPGTNLLTNSGFETDSKITNAISGWNSWSNNGLAAQGTWAPEAHGGTYFAYQWQSTSYSAWTYQRKTNLANGLYTLRAWVRSSGGQQEAQMGAVLDGGRWTYTNIPVGWKWIQITLKDIPVTDGTAEVGFWSVAGANQEIDFDDVEFFKQ